MDEKGEALLRSVAEAVKRAREEVDRAFRQVAHAHAEHESLANVFGHMLQAGESLDRAEAGANLAVQRWRV